jgi:uncharacterized protein YuzE
MELKSGPGVETREIASGVIADIDDDGGIVGFDIDNASKSFDLSTLETVALPIATKAA